VFLGGVSLAVGAGLMPLMVGRLATSHAICVLPYGRLKLFLSALITAMLVSIPVPLFAVLAQITMVPAVVAARYTMWQVLATGLYLFWSFYIGTFLIATWVYVALWFATSERNARGLAKCLLVVILIIYAPTQWIRDLDPQFHLTAWECVVMWAAFGAWLAYAPRWRGRTFNARLGRIFDSRKSSGYSAGHEFEMLLGTARPWLFVLALSVPILVQATVGFRLSGTWLLYLTLLSAISGALTGRAAERSHAIWLRARWSREELFARVEGAFWKHNGPVLAMLLIALVAGAQYFALPPRIVPLGVPLLVLGMILSTYLGLIMTRGLRWIEATIAIVIVLALMGTAVLTVREGSDSRVVIGLQIGFAVIAVVLRFTARRRWHRIDWMSCRAERVALATDR
jgi:hypothetical protein